MLELVSGSSGISQPHLLLWNGDKAISAPQIEDGDCTYAGPELPSSLYHAIRLPARWRSYGSVRKLFTSLADLFKNSLDFPDRESRLLASFCLGSWVADRLSIAPSLAILAPDQGRGIELLRLLHCVCRRALMLAEITRGGLRSLPSNLSLTLLICQGELKPNLQRLLRASGYRGLHLPGNRGGVVDLNGPKAILWDPDVSMDSVGEGMVQISLPPSCQSPELDERRLDEIASDFQPRLLMYRLKNCAKVRQSQVEVTQLSVATRPLARALAACFPGDSDLARDIVLLLGPQDEEIRAQRFLDVNCMIVEILLGELHSGKRTKVQVGDLAKDVTALAQSRGEIKGYGTEVIGWKLKGLSIPKHTNTSGRHVVLDRDTSRRMHRLARAYELQCLQRVKDGCSDCVAATGRPVAQ